MDGVSLFWNGYLKGLSMPGFKVFRVSTTVLLKGIVSGYKLKLFCDLAE
jgi:hypothetical protein